MDRRAWMKSAAAAALALGLVTRGMSVTGQAPGEPAARGARLFMVHGCYGCHTVGVMGTPIGPDLSRVGRRYSEAQLAEWLRNPEAQRPAHMPRIEIAAGEVQALAAYLASLR